MRGCLYISSSERQLGLSEKMEKYFMELPKIGDMYEAKNKRKDICTVVDILKTFNNAGELVKTIYLCQHDFLGQK